MGGYLGGRLAQSGEDVTFLVRPRRREQLLQRGLRIRSPLGDVDLRVRAESEVEKVGSCDVVIVAVKNYDLDSVLDKIAYLGKGGPWIISVLNGVEHIEKICSVVGRDRILGGPVYIEAALGPDGEVIHKSMTPSLTLGRLTGDAAIAKPIASIFEKAGVKATVSEDLLVDLWRKYLFITVISSMTSLARRPIGNILSDILAKRVLEDLTSEVVSIAHAVDSKLASLDAVWVTTRAKNVSPGTTSSMLKDIEMGSRLEVDSIQGYLVRKAEEFKLSVPVLKTCYGVLRVLASGSQ